MWKKIKEFFKKYWLLFIGILSSIIAFICGRNRRRDSILRDAEDRAKQSGQQFDKHRESLSEARDQTIRIGDDVESSLRQTEDIRRDNQSISESITGAREQLSNIESSIDDRIAKLRKRKEN